MDGLPRHPGRRPARLRHCAGRSRLEPGCGPAHLVQGGILRHPLLRDLAHRRPAGAAGAGLSGRGPAGAHRLAALRLGIRRVYRGLAGHPAHRYQGLHGHRPVRDGGVPGHGRGRGGAHWRSTTAVAGAGRNRGAFRGAVHRHGRLCQSRGGLVNELTKVDLLSVFFPMWNEEDYVERAVRAAEEECQRLIDLGEIAAYELLIVDDCSTDRTPEIADALAAADPRIRVVHHPVNRGLGGSIKTGFDSVRGDVVLYTDADLPFEMLELGRALRVLRHYEADMVSAYRLDRTGEGPRRAVYSFAYNWLVQLVVGTRGRDINFAFKLVRRQVLEAARPVSEGSFIDAELVIRAQRLGFSIIQIGVDYFPRTRGVSTLSSPAVIRGMLKEMRQLRSELAAVAPVSR